jgi:pimeloyl-ACP methyl ester carboxylesterase
MEAAEEKAMRSKLLTLLVILVLCTFSPPTDASFGLRIESCFLEEIGEEVLCGTYEVMENRNVRKGAKIRLNFIILPAWTSHPAPDPIFVFAGGPGVGAAAWVDSYAWEFQTLRWERDIVLVDQRGTGDSNPLHCLRIGDPESAQTYLQDMFPEDYVRECREELKKRARVSYYDSFTAMQDIDELRSALGYETINVTGGSYGGYAAVVYMKYFPERVRCALLSYSAWPGWGYHATIAPSTQRVLERLLEDCAADPECAADYPGLPEKLEAVVDRLKQEPITITITTPWNGRLETVTFTHNNFIHGIRALLYSTGRSRWIPAFIHWASLGIWQPIVEYTAEYLKWINDDIMDGMFLTVTCTETAPYIDYAAAKAASEGTFMGAYRLDQQQNACVLWVRGSHPEDFHIMPEMYIPALIISGELDPVIPPEYGEELARHFPNSRHVIIPNEGHGVGGELWQDCLAPMAAQFFSQGHVEGLDFSCLADNQRPPFVSWREYENQESEAARTIWSDLGISQRNRSRKQPSRRR